MTEDREQDQNSGHRSGLLSSDLCLLTSGPGERQRALARAHGELGPKADQQQQQAGGKEVLVALDHPRGVLLGEFALAAGLDGLVEQRGQVHPRAGVGVGAARDLRQLLQRRAVEPRQHHGAALVLDEAAARIGDEGALRRADAEADDADALRLERLDQGFPVVLRGLAVAEDDEVAVGGRGAEGLDGGLEHRLVVGAALGEVVGVHRGQELPQDLVVGAERALEEGRAGEQHEADALALQAVEQRLDEQLTAVEARGLHVLREHRLGQVHRDEHLARLVEHLLLNRAPLRAGQGDDAQRQAEPEPEARARLRRGVPGAERDVERPGPRAGDLGPVRRGARGVARQLPGKEEHERHEQPEEMRRVEGHAAAGARLRRKGSCGGSAKSAPRNSNAAPGIENQWNSSVVSR